MTYPIPQSALAQHIAVLGKTGSGKTTAIKAGMERLLDDKARVCIVDPTGAWWGLKSSATGRSVGYPVVIFGGSHADFPLAGTHGEAIAEIVGTSNTPSIIDTSQLKVSERTRFFADFADAIMRKNRGPLHLVIDEAHVFMPQGKVPDPAAGVMLAAGNNMVSGGRSRGLRIVLITQRPAKLHKDSLTQAETLVAMRLIAPQDRKAVEEWIKDNADATKAREIIESLATLKTGQGWVWAPEIGLLERATFPRIKTFDSSAAPSHDDAHAGPVLASIDKDSILSKLKTHADEVKANDPAELKKRIRELEKQLAAKPSADLDAALIDRDTARIAAFNEGANHGYQCGWNEHRRAMLDALEAIPAKPHVIAGRSNKPRKYAEPMQQSVSVPPSRSTYVAHSDGKRVVVEEYQRPQLANKRNSASSDLPKGEAATLAACIQFPDGLRREQLTVLTGYKRSSRDAYIQRLREKGFVDAAGDRVIATDAGRSALPDAEPLPTGDALQEYWLQRLPEGERKILAVLIQAYPNEMSRFDIDEATGYKRSSRDAYLQRMRAKQLIEESGRGAVRASEDLF